MDMGGFFLPAKEPSYIVMSQESGRPYYVGHRPRDVELLVPMCCSKCEEKVRESMLELEGVQGVLVDPRTQRVTVSCFGDPLRTLKKARKVTGDSQLLQSGDHLRPWGFQSSSFVQPASTYQTAYHRHAPSYNQTVQLVRPSYDEMVITNPCYVKHIQSPECWR